MIDRIVVSKSSSRLFPWVGPICLLLIIPIKAIRFLDKSTATTFLIGITPSLLGPIGLLFLILGGSGKLSRLTLLQTTLLVAVVALGLEFAQLIPIRGILAKVHYTFDWYDVLASLASVLIGYLVALFLTKKKVT
jgi:hypothetical protein